VVGELELSCNFICSNAKIEFKPETGSILRQDKIKFKSRPTTCPSKIAQEAAMFRFMERNYLEKGLRPSNRRPIIYLNFNSTLNHCILGYDEEFKTLYVECTEPSRTCVTFRPLSREVDLNYLANWIDFRKDLAAAANDVNEKCPPKDEILDAIGENLASESLRLAQSIIWSLHPTHPGVFEVNQPPPLHPRYISTQAGGKSRRQTAFKLMSVVKGKLGGIKRKGARKG
jgi:hypothetical protein